MKRLFGLLLGLVLLLASCSTPIPSTTSTPASTSQPGMFDTPWDDFSIFKGGLVPAKQSALDQLKDASVYHLEFNIAEDLYHVIGREEVKYMNTESVPLDQIQLRLFPNILGGEMTVTNTQINGTGVTPSYGLQDSVLTLLFSPALQPGQSAIIGMDFAVTVPQSLDQSYGVLSYNDDVLALAHAYPMISVYDDEGWNAEIPQEYGDVTYTDASFYLARVTAPQGVTLVPSGREISRDEAGQTQTVTVAAGPARDFYLAASPNYEKVSRKLGEVTINSFATAENKEGAEMALDVAGRAITDFNASYVHYPYNELDIVATPTTAGGIEYPGLVVIAARLYEGAKENPVYMEATVAHEVAHQWFYNLVGDDQLDDPWLDESLAQFSTLQYYGDEYGSSGAQGFEDYLNSRWAEINRAMIPVGLPVSKYTQTQYGAIVYGRGPLFFVALEQKMGKESFDAFLKDYTEQLCWGIATPEFLQSLAEKHCACDLDAFFQEWIYP
jgi:hypothetical protein